MDLESLLRCQRAWSLKTFGPAHTREAALKKLDGLRKHLIKETCEIEKEPLDVEEWCDAIIIAMDGALRASAALERDPAPHVISILFGKLLHNWFERDWPPLDQQKPGEPVEHVRDTCGQCRSFNHRMSRCDGFTFGRSEASNQSPACKAFNPSSEAPNG